MKQYKTILHPQHELLSVVLWLVLFYKPMWLRFKFFWSKMFIKSIRVQFMSCLSFLSGVSLWFYLFEICLHVWVGGLCGGGGAVVVVSQVIFELVSLSLYWWLPLLLLLLPLGFCFASQLPFGFQPCRQHENCTHWSENDYKTGQSLFCLDKCVYLCFVWTERSAPVDSLHWLTLDGQGRCPWLRSAWRTLHLQDWSPGGLNFGSGGPAVWCCELCGWWAGRQRRDRPVLRLCSLCSAGRKKVA